MIRVTIASPQGQVAIERPRYRAAVQTVLAGEGVHNAEISLAFVDNPTIHRLNRQFLDHDEPTDVLSFPLGEAGGKLSGELVIGAEVGLAQAQAHGHDVHAELTLYVIHGLLHLCGHDDSTPKARAVMRALERRYLKVLQLPDIAPE